MPTTPSASVLPLASAVVQQGGETLGPYLVETLSPRGMVMRGAFGGLAPGRIRLVLSLASAALLRLEGWVVQVARGEGEEPEAQVVFEAPEPSVATQIEAEVAHAEERGKHPCVVALVAGHWETARLRRAVQRLGRNIVFFDDESAARAFLARHPEACDTILIDEALIHAQGAFVLSLWRDEYPEKSRVLLTPFPGGGSAPLPGYAYRVDGVLAGPWTADHLTAAFASRAPRGVTDQAKPGRAA